MRAFTDIGLNSNFSGGDVYGAPASIFAPVVRFVCRLVLEPNWNPMSAWHPMHMASVYMAPAVIPTAAVGKGPWDSVYGPIGIGAAHGNINIPALVLAPQVGTSSFA